MRHDQETTPAKKAGGILALFAALFALWFFILPPSVGGRTLLLTTHGISMEPLLHSGDLAVLRKESSYRVGDIVEYHSTALDTPILHRIVNVDNGQISTKGDNNNFVDLDHPTPNQINGKMIHRFKGLGKDLGYVKSLPARIIGAALVGFAAYSFLMQRQNDPTKGRTSTTDVMDQVIKARSGGRRTRSTLPSFQKFGRSTLVPTGIVITSFSLLFGLVGFTHATSSDHAQTVIYNLNGNFDYSGDATGGDLVYRNGQVRTGDTIYTAMVQSLHLSFNYSFAGLGKFEGSGTIAMKAEIDGASGWTHPLVLSPPTSFTGSNAKVSADVNLADFRDIVTQVGSYTHINDSAYTIIFTPVVTVNGTLAGQPINDSLNDAVKFSANGATITPQNKNGAPTGDSSSPVSTTTPATTAPAPAGVTPTASTTGFTAAKGGQVTIPPGAAQTLSAAGVTFGIFTLRLFSIIGLILGIGMISSGVVLRRRPIRLPPVNQDFDRAMADYGDLVVPVAQWQPNGTDKMIIDVPSLDDLARVAEHHHGLILREQGVDGKNTFVFTHKNVTYRYQFTSAEARFHVKPTESAPASEETIS